jgi:excisionase family DNA binding protein
MPKRPGPASSPEPEGALYVRLPASAVDRLHRAAEALGVAKKDLVASLVTKYVDPDSQRGLSALGTTMSRPHRLPMTLGGSGPSVGSYSFLPNDPPEVMTAEQAAELLQLEEKQVLVLAADGELPGRKLGKEWRFSRAAILAWLANPERK